MAPVQKEKERVMRERDVNEEGGYPIAVVVGAAMVGGIVLYCLPKFLLVAIVVGLMVMRVGRAHEED